MLNTTKLFGIAKKRSASIIVPITLALVGTSAYANTEAFYAHSTRSLDEKVSVNNKEKFFYNKGITDGYEEGKRDGYDLAMRDAKRMLKKYKRRIKALESGKYISKKGKITPPRLYQEKQPDGTIRVVVRGCSIEGEIAPQDILAFPEYDGSEPESHAARSYVATKSQSPSDSVSLAGIDYSKKNRPVDPASVKRVTFRTLEDTKFNRNLLRGAGLPFSIQPNSRLRVMFENNSKADSFMARHGLTERKDYK